MLYKHWKKILLSLTAFFWASCDDTVSASNEPESSSSVEAPKSSAVTGGTSSSSTETAPESSATDNPASSVAAAESSDTETSAASSSDTPNIGSSNSTARSSSAEMIAPKYGVPMSSSMVAAKYGVLMPSATCEKVGSKLTCDDGVTCDEIVSETMQSPECTGDVCAKYGVVIVKDTTYKCDDGKIYKAAEFRSKYDILDGAVDLYGCPSDICWPDTLVEAQPLYGISNMVTRPQ